MGGKFYVNDNVETPDTMLALSNIRNSSPLTKAAPANPLPMFNSGDGTAIHGTEGSILLTRSNCTVIPAGQDSKLDRRHV